MFSAKVGSVYEIKAKDFSDDTYWTCFAFADFTPDELHCTHKFFGEQSSELVEEIVKILDEYFAAQPFSEFTVAFTKEAFFGEDKDVRVLKPDFGKEDREVFLLDLREQLGRFAEDRFPSYQPHVTTPDRETVNLPFTRYCLCQGGRIVREYSS